MPKHEQYQELCALAMIGEMSTAEMQDLRQHLTECADCRREYQEFTQLVLPQLSASDESVPPVSGFTADDAHASRARFLERAQAAGISFSGKALNPPDDAVEEPAAVSAGAPIEMPVRKRAGLGVAYRGAVAAALLLAAAAGGFTVANWYRRSGPAIADKSATAPARVAAADSGKDSTGGSQALSAVLDADTKTIVELEEKLRDADAKLATERSDAESRAKDRAALQQQIDAQKQGLIAFQAQGQLSNQAATALRAQLAALQARADAQAANAGLDQLKMDDLSAQVKDLNASLGREREMLSAGRDMRDMMAARNLHIVDVFDTDSRGKTRPAFGRIFFAENRQLVFYAYDLNEKRLEDAHYDYRIWGQKEGQPHTARSLGIFYSDDKTQHRWLFKCDDPKVLSEIDSVFVTLEPATADPNRPRGPQLMYAYLRGQPNHP